MSSTEKAPLEDLMVAMDVVDTLRHRQQLVDRELDASGRRDRLIQQLRDIYASQGLDVTDAMLEEGVKALEEDRFKYSPPRVGPSYWLALFYVNRDRWLKPFLLLLGLCAVGLLLYYLFAIRPIHQAQNALPDALANNFNAVLSSTQDQRALERANTLNLQAKQAIKEENYAHAEDLIDALSALQKHVALAYTVRIVQRPGELSGVWRVPDVNTQARNYYLIVEAIDARGDRLSLPIESEETGKTRLVQQWGIRVDAEIFQRIANDKRDDGIIQNRQVGNKASGKLEPEYVVPTLGGTITEW